MNDALDPSKWEQPAVPGLGWRVPSNAKCTCDIMWWTASYLISQSCSLGLAMVISIDPSSISSKQITQVSECMPIRSPTHHIGKGRKRSNRNLQQKPPHGPMIPCVEVKIFKSSSTLWIVLKYPKRSDQRFVPRLKSHRPVDFFKGGCDRRAGGLESGDGFGV